MSSLVKGRRLKKRKEKQNEKDCKESGKDHCQKLERSKRTDDQNFGLQSLKRQIPPKIRKWLASELEANFFVTSIVRPVFRCIIALMH